MSDDSPAPGLPPVDPAAASRVPSTSLTPELLASLLVEGDDELAAWALRHALAEAPRAQVFDGLLRDAMRLIGDRWASGRWSVADEHLASRTLVRTLERIRQPQGPEGRIGPLAVLAGVAGEHHVIGLACLEQVLADQGWMTANLGADLPAADLGRFVSRGDVSLVALSLGDPDRLGALADSVAAVREASAGHRIPILVGGLAAEQPDLGKKVGADWVGASLVDAAAFAARVAPRDVVRD